MNIKAKQEKIKQQVKTFYRLWDEINTGPFEKSEKIIEEVETMIAAKSEYKFEGDIFSKIDQMNKDVQEMLHWIWGRNFIT